MNIEEMQTEFAEATEDTEVTTEVDLSAFDDGWDDDGQPNSFDSAEEEAEEVTGEEAEADQQEAETAEASDNTEEPEQTEEPKDEAADQRFVLKHLDEVKEVGRDEVITLAQKGMDYDRKVPKLNAKIAEYEEFLNELAAPGKLTIEQLIDSTRARLLQKKKMDEGEDISEADAIFEVQRAREEKSRAKEGPEKTEAPEEKAQEATPVEVKRFMEVYPNVKAEDIPQSVWDDVKRTGDLLGAYTRYENAELKRRMTALETNKKNEERSTGSRKTAGSAKARDAFDEGWDSI